MLSCGPALEALLGSGGCSDWRAALRLLERLRAMDPAVAEGGWRLSLAVAVARLGSVLDSWVSV